MQGKGKLARIMQTPVEKLSPQDVLKKQMCANAVANGGRLTTEDLVAFTRPYGIYESERYADIAHGIDKYRIKTGDLTGLNKTEKKAWKHMLKSLEGKPGV